MGPSELVAENAPGGLWRALRAVLLGCNIALPVPVMSVHTNAPPFAVARHVLVGLRGDCVGPGLSYRAVDWREA